jgi:hypothetical protein
MRSAAAARGVTESNTTKIARDEQTRRKLSISLSPRSSDAFQWLKEMTDADTDSEVVRNALRLHYVLLQGHMEGKEFFFRASKGSELTKVNLFVNTLTDGESTVTDGE